MVTTSTQRPQDFGHLTDRLDVCPALLGTPLHSLNYVYNIAMLPWGACGKQLGCIQGDGPKQKESQTKRDRNMPLKVLREGNPERRPGDHVWGIFCGPPGGRGTGNTGKEVGLRGGFDHKLERISRIKLNEDIQHVGETERFF